jgi:hypothetical protein
MTIWRVKWKPEASFLNLCRPQLTPRHELATTQHVDLNWAQSNVAKAKTFPVDANFSVGAKICLKNSP